MLCLPCVLVARKYLLLNIFQNHLVGFFSSVPDDTSSANCHLINLVIRCNRLLFIYHRCHRHRHPPWSSCTIIIIVAIKIQEPPTWVEQASMSEVPVVFWIFIAYFEKWTLFDFDNICQNDFIMTTLKFLRLVRWLVEFPVECAGVAGYPSAAWSSAKDITGADYDQFV